MANTALVIGGTGPTGPYVLQGLLDRGYDVSIFHRGTHEPADLPDVRHIHGDPHFRETINEALTGRSYDVVIAAYGRTRLLAEAFVGRAGHFLSIGGPPRYAGFYHGENSVPSGPSQPLREDARLVTDVAVDLPAINFAKLIAKTEEKVFAAQPEATHLVYPVVYGPRNVWPWEWSVLKRVLDGRRQIIVTDNGHELHTRGAARNLAHALLCAVDHPAVARGQIYNTGDDDQFNVRQWVEMAIAACGSDAEVVSVPGELAPVLRGAFVPSAKSIAGEALLDTSKLRGDLEYRDVIRPAAALAESIEWYRQHPIDDPSEFSALVDPFDYELEDRLVARWSEFRAEVQAWGDYELAHEVHPMPHPKKAGELLDQKAR